MGHPGCCHLHSHPVRSAVPLPHSLAPGNPVPTLRRWNQNIPCGEASPPAKRENQGISVKFGRGRNGRGRKSRVSGRDKQTQGHTGSEGSARAGPGLLRGGLHRAVPPWREGPAGGGGGGGRGEVRKEGGEAGGGAGAGESLSSCVEKRTPQPPPRSVPRGCGGETFWQAVGAGQGPRAVSARAGRAALPLLHPALRSAALPGRLAAGRARRRLWEGAASPSTRCPGRTAPGAAAGAAPGAGGAGQRERGRGVPRGAAPRQARAFPGFSRPFPRNGAAVGAAAGRAPRSEGGGCVRGTWRFLRGASPVGSSRG